MNIEIPENASWYALGMTVLTAVWLGMRRAFAWRASLDLLRTEFKTHVVQEDTDRKELRGVQQELKELMMRHDERVSTMARDLNQLIGTVAQLTKSA